MLTSAEEELALVYSPYVESEGLLRALNIVDGEIDYTANVTRGQAAKLISLMLGENGSSASFRGIFSDVSESNENAIYIEKLADLGIVKGDGDLKFRPDDLLNYNELVRMSVNALGYGILPDINAKVNQIATKEGLTDSIRREYAVVNLGDVLVVLKNTLLARPLMQEKWGADMELYISEQDLLHKVYEGIYTDGIIVKNDLTYLWSYKSDSADKVEIELADKSRLTLRVFDMTNIRDDLGKKVTVFYKYDEDRGENVYIYHYAKQNNKIVRINLDEIDYVSSDFEKREIEYYKRGSSTSKVLDIAASYNIIYNNAAYKLHTFDFTALEDKVGYLELIDANNDNAYETVKIKVYSSVVVGNKSSEYNFITDKYDKERKVNTDEKLYKNIFVYDKDGKAISLDNISIGSVISVASSDVGAEGENVLEIHLSTDYINGKITAYKEKADPAYVEIEHNNRFNLFDRAKNDDITIGENVIAYLDVFSNVVFIADDYEMGMNYGILTSMDFDPDTINDEIKVRYLNSVGELVETKLSSNVIIDAKSYKDNAKGAVSYLSEIEIKQEEAYLAKGIVPMRYKADDNGEIRIIDTHKKNEETPDDERDTFEFVGGGKLGYISGNILGWTVPYSSDSLVYTLTLEDVTDVEEYENPNCVAVKVAATVIKSGIEHKVLAFKSDKESMYADFVIRLSDNDLEYGTSFFVVDEVTEGYNTIREKAMLQLNGYLKGAYTEVFVSETASGYDAIKKLKRGDVIRYIENADGSIIKYESIFIAGSEGAYTLSNVSGGSLNPKSIGSVTILAGYVYEKEDSLVKTNQYDFTTFVPNAKNVKWGAETLRYSAISAQVPVVTVDLGDDEIKEGSVEDILDFKNFDENASLVLMRFRSGTLNEVVVYNK